MKTKCTYFIIQVLWRTNGFFFSFNHLLIAIRIKIELRANSFVKPWIKGFHCLKKKESRWRFRVERTNYSSKINKRVIRILGEFCQFVTAWCKCHEISPPKFQLNYHVKVTPIYFVHHALFQGLEPENNKIQSF